MLQPLIWPLNKIRPADLLVLRAGLKPVFLLSPAFMSQRPNWANGLLAPKIPVNLPWNSVGLPSLIDILIAGPRVVHQLFSSAPTYFRLTGTTKDSTGAALGNCVVDWFNTVDDAKLGTTTSDANGLFEFRTAGQPPNAYYLVAYKVGSPDVAGTTVNTLYGT